MLSCRVLSMPLYGADNLATPGMQQSWKGKGATPYIAAIMGGQKSDSMYSRAILGAQEERLCA